MLRPQPIGQEIGAPQHLLLFHPLDHLPILLQAITGTMPIERIPMYQQWI